jgi:hypothetical protein
MVRFWVEMVSKQPKWRHRRCAVAPSPLPAGVQMVEGWCANGAVAAIELRLSNNPQGLASESFLGGAWVVGVRKARLPSGSISHWGSGIPMDMDQSRERRGARSGRSSPCPVHNLCGVPACHCYRSRAIGAAVVHLTATPF